MLESTQQIKKIDLDYYIFNHQWFRVVDIILCNLLNTNSQIFPSKVLPVNPITDYQQINKRKRKKKDTNSKHF